MTAGATATVVVVTAFALEDWMVWSWIFLGLLVPSLLWISGGAATSLIGAFTRADIATAPPPGWSPRDRTAILLTLCREDPVAVARRLAELSRQRDRAGLADTTSIFVLSDTFGEAQIAAEEAALAPLVAAAAITYRRRAVNRGRKPGNIAEWFEANSHAFAYMLVLDADSWMSGARIARMIHRMQSEPHLGLLQAGMGLRRAKTRFGQVQRTAVRLLGPAFVSGFAVWAGDSANYWGHNALIRVQAFAWAACLPRLAGRPPFGGDILSHDFVEAAYIRRAGWRVAIDPDMKGSAEDGPQTLAEFHRRNRRWCQGNLQHARLIAEPGLHPLSRLHMASGAFGYLAAPVWMALVLLMGTGAVVVGGVAPFALIVVLLLIPKLVGFWQLGGPESTAWRRRIAAKAGLVELLLSALLAPIVMVRQTGAVLSVLAGQDCGWKSPKACRRALPDGVAEVATGIALLAVVLSVNPAAAPWLLPVVLPLLGTPVLSRMLEAPR